MNALEIANLLEVDSWYKLVTREEIATILRQQQAELKEKDELAQAWILYATKVEMLMPTMWDSDTAREMGWSAEYLKGYNDAIRGVNKVFESAKENNDTK